MLLLQLNPNERSKKKIENLRDYNFANVSQINTISFDKGETSI